jgi:hypothetical protein
VLSFLRQIDFHGSALQSSPEFWALTQTRLQAGCWTVLLGFLAGEVAFRHPPYQSPAGHLHDQVLSGRTIHSLAQTAFAILRDQPRLVILPDEVIQVMISFEDYLPASTSISATRAAFWAILLALKSDAPFAAVTGTGIYLYLVNEHPTDWLNELRWAK